MENDAYSLRFGVEVRGVEIMILFSMRVYLSIYESLNIIISKMNKIKNSK